LPSLTNASPRCTGLSVLTNTVFITARAPPVQVKPDPDAIVVIDGGLSDHEETGGVECDVAYASPFKGFQRLNSEVRATFNLQLIIPETLIYNRLSWSKINSSRRRKNKDLPNGIN
jgi:hypothetical protein